MVMSAISPSMPRIERSARPSAPVVMLGGAASAGSPVLNRVTVAPTMGRPGSLSTFTKIWKGGGGGGSAQLARRAATIANVRLIDPRLTDRPKTVKTGAAHPARRWQAEGPRRLSIEMFMRVSYLVAFSLGLVACGTFKEPPPPPPFQVAFVVEGDPGKKVNGAEIQRGGKTLATTGADGRATLVLRGAEGELAEATVVCPAGFLSPPKPLPFHLTRLSGNRVPEFGVHCAPTRRKVVVAVRANNGPHIPVLYLNQVVAMTDETGAAHFALDLEPGTFQVALDTSERRDLKPENPRQTFTVQKDDIFVFDQNFKIEKKFVPKVKVKGPVCISCPRLEG
jgi:hypothetical protein